MHAEYIYKDDKHVYMHIYLATNNNNENRATPKNVENDRKWSFLASYGRKKQKLFTDGA